MGEVAWAEKIKILKLASFPIIICTFVAMKESTTLLDGDLTIYARWFYYSLLEQNDKRATDGVQFPIFATRHNSIMGFLPALEKVVADEEIKKLIANIKDKLGINIEILNLYMLCSYVNEMIREQYVVLLKIPTKEAFEGLGELEEITFKDKEGKTVTTNYVELANFCMDSAKKYLNAKGDIIETAKMGRVDKIGSIVDRNIIQSQFAYYIAKFFEEAFPDANRNQRGKKAIVSPLEQELILRLMVYFDLGLKTNATATENIRKKIIMYNNYHYPFDVFTLYLKHDDWKRKINWKDSKLKLAALTKEEEDRIFHNPSTLIKD